jgi:thiol-disulfide isomerase/thioredoxin
VLPVRFPIENFRSHEMNATSALILGMCTLNGSPEGEVLNFSAKWCGPCQTVAPVVEKLKRQGYPIRKIDVSDHPELARKYRIDTIPQFILVVDGKELSRIKGIQSESSLKQLIAKLPQPAQDSELENAAEIATNQDGPLRLGGIPIPFLGKSKTISPEEIETVRGQSEAGSHEQEYSNRTVADPQLATVRLSVNQSGSIHRGTGTIIESNSQGALAITCGHLFRNSNPQTKMTVEVFEEGRTESYPARLVRYDDRADVGLIAFEPGKTLPKVRVAANPETVRPRDLVSSMGCGNGSDPTRWQMYVKSVDAYLNKSIIECNQAPVYGRSGGGLFNRGGELIGICMAADKNNNTGLYAGLKEIHALLDQVSLTSLYQQSSNTAKIAVNQAQSGHPPKADAILGRETPGAAFLDSKVTPPTAAPVAAKPVDLSEDEVDIIAASLQMSGRQGVSISIQTGTDLPGGHQVKIVNRVARIDAALARVDASPRDRVAAESFEWANLLDSPQPRQSAQSMSDEFPVWARE